MVCLLGHGANLPVTSIIRQALALCQIFCSLDIITMGHSEKVVTADTIGHPHRDPTPRLHISLDSVQTMSPQPMVTIAGTVSQSVAYSEASELARLRC